MQTPTAPSQVHPPVAPETSLPLPWYQRRTGICAMLAVLAAVVLMVSSGVFRRMLLQGGEQDARLALKWIGLELSKSETPLQSGLAPWLKDQKRLRHKMGDVRFPGSDIHYHGYRLGIESHGNTQTLFALPLEAKKTGREKYFLDL